MSNSDPSSWIDRVIGWCFGILLASVALYCAVAVVRAILPALVIIFGVVGAICLIVGGIVVFRTIRNRW